MWKISMKCWWWSARWLSYEANVSALGPGVCDIFHLLRDLFAFSLVWCCILERRCGLLWNSRWNMIVLSPFSSGNTRMILLIHLAPAIKQRETAVCTASFLRAQSLDKRHSEGLCAGTNLSSSLAIACRWIGKSSSCKERSGRRLTNIFLRLETWISRNCQRLKGKIKGRKEIQDHFQARKETEGRQRNLWGRKQRKD